ncbi:MAG: histidinol-phosphate transaminase [Bacteroidota bacterium]
MAFEFKNQIQAEQFITANAGSEVMDLFIRAFVRPGDEVILSNPCFIPYNTFSRWMGAKVIDVPLKGKHYELDVDGILHAITDRTRILFLTSPNNPSGTYLPKAQVDHLLEQLPKNILVIYDEVYRHFADAEDYTDALEYVKKGHPVVGLNSFSKTYGLAALRIGYAYTTLEIAQYVRQICKPFMIPKLNLEAAIAALGDHDFINETVNLVRTERQFLTDQFTQLGLDFTPSQSNFFLIDPPLPEEAFVNYLYEKGVMVRPVTSFGAPGKVRISIGQRPANEALIEALRQI